MAAPDFTVGDKCLVRHTDQHWWQAEVVRKRVREDGQEELQWKWSGRKTARPNAWKAASDPMIRALPSSISYMKSWNSKQGHVGRDRWIAASLLAEEGEGDSRRFLVRWRGWSSAYDSWEPAAHIIDAQLIEAFEADKTQQAADAAAACTAAQAAEMEEKRRERAQYARNFIQAVREKTLAELERPALKEKAAAHALFPGENCADWEFKALHEWLQDQVPEGEDVKAHLSDLVQTRGSRGAPTVAFEFSVLSHRLAGLFVDCVDNADGTRWEHVKYKDHGAGMAVCLLPPFKRAKSTSQYQLVLPCSLPAIA